MYTKGLRINRAEQAFSTIFNQFQIKPDLISFTSMINMYANSRKYDRIMLMHEKVKELNLKVDDKYCELLVKSCVAIAPYFPQDVVIMIKDLVHKYQYQPNDQLVTQMLKRTLDLEAGRQIIAATHWIPPPTPKKFNPKPFKRKKYVKLKTFRKRGLLK